MCRVLAGKELRDNLELAIAANIVDVQLANRTSRKLPFVQLAFFHRLRLLLWISSSSANISNVVNSVEKVDPPERGEISFQFIGSA